MTLKTYDFEQGTDEWDAARRGIITASVIGKLITPGLKVADNDTSRSITLTLTAERITGYTDPVYVSADMERGTIDEPIARDHYSEHIAPVTQCGFMVETGHGFGLGYSPDGLVGDDGLIEIKSRRQKAHLQTILTDAVPDENMAQIQCGLLVSGREWCDYVSWCGGMPMWVIRVLPDLDWFDAIVLAGRKFDDTAKRTSRDYGVLTDGLPETDRRISLVEEMRI